MVSGLSACSWKPGHGTVDIVFDMLGSISVRTVSLLCDRLLQEW
jgi:hypothetical protein